MDEKKMEMENAPAFRHSLPIQMRFNDVDVLGHINNSMYFQYFDLGKSAYFTTIRKGAFDWNKVDVVIANVNCNFYAPMFLGEPVSVVTRVKSIHERSFRVHQRIVNVVTKEIKSECETVMVGFDPVAQTSARLSEGWIKSICEYEGRNLLEQNNDND